MAFPENCRQRPAQRASLERGRRTATVRALTDCRIVSYLAADLPVRDLTELAAGHLREGPASS